MMHHTQKESHKETSYGAMQSSLRNSSHFELPTMTPQFVRMEAEKKHWNSIATELSMLLTLISAILKELQSD